MKSRTLAAPILILLLTVMSGVAYAHWQDMVAIRGRVKMGKWKARVVIHKTLEGAFTDPSTGGTLAEPTDLIAIAAGFPTRFRLTIRVENRGSTTLTGVVVKDTIDNTVAPREWHPEEGVTWSSHASGGDEWDGVHFGFNELKWEVGALKPGEEASLEIWIETLQNPNDKHVPTSGDEGDGQEIEMNDGATVTASSTFSSLSATTEGITMVIEDDGVEGNGIGRVATPLPHKTPLAEDRYP